MKKSGMRENLEGLLEGLLMVSIVVGGSLFAINGATYGTYSKNLPEKRVTLIQFRKALDTAYNSRFITNEETLAQFPGYYLATRNLSTYTDEEFSEVIEGKREDRPFRVIPSPEKILGLY